MTPIQILPEHREALGKLVYAVQFIVDDRQTLESEQQIASRLEMKARAVLSAFLQRAYGIDLQDGDVAIDLERNLITTADGESEDSPAGEAAS